MEFKEERPIYRQIADIICEDIMLSKWKDDDRIPSVRETAVELQVNPNTVVRSYNFLSEREIIYNKRGIGYFISEGAKTKTRRLMKEIFMDKQIKEFFHTCLVIGLTPEELKELFKEYLKEAVSEEK